MKRIPLTQGKFAIVDDEDYEELSKYKWFLAGPYACRVVSRRLRLRRRHVLMHRQLLNIPEGLFGDHINQDTLDNRRCNIRIASKAQNGYNRGPISRNKLKAKGITYDPDRNRFRVRVNFEGGNHHIGRFKTLNDAKAAYASASAFFHGEFARTA